MRHPGVEHDHVARPREDRRDVERVHDAGAQRAVGILRQEDARAGVARELEAAVVDREGVDGGHQRHVLVDAEVDVGRRVLVRRESGAARQLEVDLVLEQHDGLADAVGEQPEHARAGEERGKPLVIRDEVLDAGEHLRRRVTAAALVVAHPAAGHLGPGGDLVGPHGEVARHLVAEEGSEPEPPVPLPMLLRCGVEHAASRLPDGLAPTKG